MPSAIGHPFCRALSSRMCLQIARQVGNGPGEVGEVEVALGDSPGLAGDGGEGRGDGLRAAVQDAEQSCPSASCAGRGRVAGVEGGGGLAQVAADVDAVMTIRTRTFRPRSAASAWMKRVICCLFRRRRPAGGRVPGRSGRPRGRGHDHVLDGLGDRGRSRLVAGFRAGVRLTAGGGGDVLRLSNSGADVGDEQRSRPSS